MRTYGGHVLNLIRMRIIIALAPWYRRQPAPHQLRNSQEFPTETAGWACSNFACENYDLIHDSNQKVKSPGAMRM